MISSVARRFTEQLIACNIYVSAGQPQHATLLMSLLQEAQEHCNQVQQEYRQQQQQQHLEPPKFNNDNNQISIVHAYSDRPYNRSSFHLAGNPVHVATVASRLATKAIQSLVQFQLPQEAEEKQSPSSSISPSTTRHPTVGLVDHIAVMPLTIRSSSSSIRNKSHALVNSDDDSNDEETFTYQEIQNLMQIQTATTTHRILLDSQQQQQQQREQQQDKLVPAEPTNASGWVARIIGNELEQKVGTHVLFYGTAHPHQTPLATVRREATSFFRPTSNSIKKMDSHGLPTPITAQNQQQEKQTQSQTCTVGAPPNFVENYNIRLTNYCNYKQAKTLTKFIRTRDGSGLAGVEALTLAYSGGRWEVACNLLQPNVTGANEIQQRANEWDKQQQDQGQQDQQPQLGQNKNSAETSSNGSTKQSLVEIGYRVGTTVDQCLQALDETCCANNDDNKDGSRRIRHNQNVQERLQGYLQGSIN